MTERRGSPLVAAAVVLVAVATRLTPLYWSPYPATHDGFFYAGTVAQALSGGAIPVPITWDGIGFNALLVTAAGISGGDPLTLAQPLVALIGGLSALTGVVVVRRVGRGLGWSPAKTEWGAAAAGLALAFEGIYLRRTGVPDEEVVALLLVPLLVIAVHQTIRTRHLGWGALAGLFVLVFPPLHSLSTIVALLSVLALSAIDVRTLMSRWSVLVAGVLTGGFAILLVGYYWFAQATPALQLIFTDRITGAPGLFVSWLVVLVVGVVWLRTTSSGRRRGAVLVGFGAVFGLLAVNTLRPVFPGTVATDPVVLGLVGLLVVPALLAAWGLDATDGAIGFSAVVLALIAGPAAMVGFALTAGLTPEYFDTAVRSQSFMHAGVLLAAVLGALTLWRREGTLLTRERAVLGVLLLAVVGTTPLAFVELDTGVLAPTTTQSEFESAEFAATRLDANWTSEDPAIRIAEGYVDPTTDRPLANRSQRATATWLRGGPLPGCPVLVRDSWFTSGANLYPLGPQELDRETYDRWSGNRSIVYSATGGNPAWIVVPRGASRRDC